MDDFYSNTYVAKTCGLELEELNQLEIIFLKVIDWDLTVTTQDYDAYVYGLHKFYT